jgi:hypothetical protein
MLSCNPFVTLSPAAGGDDTGAARTSQNSMAVTSGSATNTAMKHETGVRTAAEQQYVRQVESGKYPVKGRHRRSPADGAFG